MRGLGYKDIWIFQNLVNVHLRFTHLSYVKFTQKVTNTLATLVNDIHVEVFGGSVLISIIYFEMHSKLI